MKARKDLPDWLRWHVYEPINWQTELGYRRHPDYCAHGVPEEGRGVGFRQCQRKPKVTIEGFGFCAQHGREVENSRANAGTLKGVEL